VYSAAGPDDPAMAALKAAVASSGVSQEIVDERVGTGLGQILDAILAKSGLTRAVSRAATPRAAQHRRLVSMHSRTGLPLCRRQVRSTLARPTDHYAGDLQGLRCAFPSP
jgi:hypothetical protein